ncbi:MAG: Phosphate transport system permease protein PstA [bacterium ADurb.Bin478]|nr:MAG: Phosphate transport system permease protein PstA [bacterium ADurb.Bin478]
MNRRNKEKLAIGVMRLSLYGIVLILAAIMSVIVVKGFSAMSWSMITQTPKGGFYLGKEGGVANAIVGSIYLAGGATSLALLISVPLAFALQKEYSSGRLTYYSRLALDVLWGTPSIVYGAFGFIIMMMIGLRSSLLAGIITLALLVTPIMTRAMEEVIRMAPQELKETAYALGLTRLESSSTVILRQTIGGLLTAVMLAFSRAIGDAASILFTAGFSDHMPGSLLDPVASLPLAIFFQIGTPIAEVQQRAYASALILFIIVLLLSLLSRWIYRKFSKHVIK